MKKFEQLTDADFSSILQNREEQIVEISEDVAELFAAKGRDFTSPTEVPPSSAVYAPDFVAQALVYGEGLKGRYILFEALIYRYGGRILYRLLNNKNYEAKIVWS